MTKKLLLLLALLSLVFVFQGCDDDDDNTTIDGDTADGDTADGDGTIDGDSDENLGGGGSNNFRGYVVDFESDVKTAGLVVYVLNNTNGLAFTDIDPETTDSEGYVEFTGLKDDYVGFLVAKKDGETVDTYQFNITAQADDEKLWSVAESTYNFAPALAGIQVDTNKGIIAGGLYWVNDQDEEEFVGCGTAAMGDGSGDVRYFNDSTLPINLEGRTSVNPLNGFFLIGNVATGTKEVQGFFDDKKIGCTQLHIFPDSIAISNIYAFDNTYSPIDCEWDASFDTTKNPMPDTCE